MVPKKLRQHNFFMSPEISIESLRYLIIIIQYRNSLCWDATQVLGNRCSIKHAFCPFMDYGFNAASKLRKLGLNAAKFFYSLFF